MEARRIQTRAASRHATPTFTQPLVRTDPPAMGSMSNLPWRRDLGLMGLGMGAGMTLAVHGLTLWPPVVLQGVMSGMMHGVVGIAAGWMVREAVGFAQPRWSANKGLLFAGAMGGLAAMGGETLMHSLSEGHTLDLFRLGWWGVGWGLAAAVAVPVAAVHRHEGRWVRPKLLALGIALGAVFQSFV